MTSLYALAVKIGPLDHVYLASDTGKTWGCFGRTSGGLKIAELVDADIDAAEKAAGPDGSAGIVYMLNGIDHQVANRILRAANPKASVTVSRATGYRVSASLYGPYGRNLPDGWSPATQVLPEDVEQPVSDLPMLYATEEPPQRLVEVSSEISAKLLEHLKKHPEALHSIMPRQFEELIAELLSSYGMKVELTPSSKDGGYDLYAVSINDAGLRSSWIIECKKWSPDRKVGVEIVRALYNVKSDLRVANALLATTSHFTKGVQDFKLSRYDLDLKDYRDIVDWVQGYAPLSDGRMYYRKGGLILPRER